jgi:hypothetical protein
MFYYQEVLSPFHTLTCLQGRAAVPAAGPELRLVLPRAKRQRLAERAGAMPRRVQCFAAGCGRDGLSMLLVDTEEEVTLCAVHHLVGRDGTPVPGQPLCVTAAW